MGRSELAVGLEQTRPTGTRSMPRACRLVRRNETATRPLSEQKVQPQMFTVPRSKVERDVRHFHRVEVAAR